MSGQKDIPHPSLIVIGASAGGIKAITYIISALPKTYSFPIIIVLHRLKNVSSKLEDVLQHNCRVTIKEADEKEKLLPKTVYITPANYHLLIEKDRTLSLDYSELVNWSRPSIDITFESASEVYKNKLMGILLTGANNDGAIGLKAIKESGGHTIVQDPKTAEASSMPNAALKLGAASEIMTVPEITEYLLKLHKEHIKKQAGKKSSPNEGNNH